jgi:DNA modification methylase
MQKDAKPTVNGDVDTSSFVTKQIQIFRGDQFKFVLDRSVDLVLTDPPFNIARETNFHTYAENTINSFKFDKDKGWDSNSPEDFRTMLMAWSREFERVLKPGGSFAVFCADEYLSDLINSLRACGLKPRRTVTWRKPNAVPVNRKHLMMSACEYIVVGVKKGRATFNADVVVHPTRPYELGEVVNIADKISSILELEIRKSLSATPTRLSLDELLMAIEEVVRKQINGAVSRAFKIYSDDTLATLCVPNHVSFNSKVGNRLHPTEKPVALLSYLLGLLSNEGDLVLDPFSGSGSTGEAALLGKRRAILIEQDWDYYKMSVARIERLLESPQMRLFE